MPEQETFDALMVPASFKRGSTLADRAGSIADYCRPLLTARPDDGGLMYFRDQPGNMVFVTRNAHDSLQHPWRHPRRGQDRYVWTARPDGTFSGVLTDDAEIATEANARPEATAAAAVFNKP